MKAHFICAFAATASLLLHQSANAQSGVGAGLTSLPCTEIIENSEDKNAGDWINFWVKGLWTGLNLASVASGKPTKDLSGTLNDVAPLKARILAYCYENTNAVLLDLALSFYSELPAHQTNE